MFNSEFKADSSDFTKTKDSLEKTLVFFKENRRALIELRLDGNDLCDDERTVLKQATLANLKKVADLEGMVDVGKLGLQTTKLFLSQQGGNSNSGAREMARFEEMLNKLSAMLKDLKNRGDRILKLLEKPGSSETFYMHAGRGYSPFVFNNPIFCKIV